MSRHETLRRWLTYGATEAEHLISPRYEPDDSGSMLALELKRRFLFDELVVTVDETAELPHDRVLGRLTISASVGATATSWSAVVIATFEGSQITGTWAVQDELPWLQALAVLPPDDEIERRLNERHDGPHGTSAR